MIISWILLAAALSFNLGAYCLTTAFVKTLGLGAEANPVMRDVLAMPRRNRVLYMIYVYGMIIVGFTFMGFVKDVGEILQLLFSIFMLVVCLFDVSWDLFWCMVDLLAGFNPQR